MNILDIKNTEEWDRIVKSFKDYDVYYLSGYIKAEQTQTTGNPLLFFYENEDFRGMNVMFQRDISEVDIFKDNLESSKYFDSFSPYGYTGFIFEGNINKENIKYCYEQYIEKLKNQGVVSAFTRYHPLLDNVSLLRDISNVNDQGKTIHIELDVTNTDVIMSNISRKRRNNIRKAQKNNVVVKNSKNPALFDAFMNMYNATMDSNRASKDYYFTKDYYETIHNNLLDNYEIFYAEYKEEIIAMAIILSAGDKLHLHLVGSDAKYNNLYAVSVLIYDISCWGHKEGYKTLHLGGGRNSSMDSLYNFKYKFNERANNQFSTGRDIINQEKYDELVALRQSFDTHFDIKNNFFPSYRQAMLKC